MIKKNNFYLSIVFLVFGFKVSAQNISEYLEVKQVYQDRGIVAVVANTTIRFGNSISVMKGNSVCDLPIDSRNGDYIFIKSQICLTIDKLVPGQRIEVALLQSPAAQDGNFSQKLSNENYNSSSNSAYLDFQMPKGNILLQGDILTESQEFSLKYLSTSVGNASYNSTTFQIGAGVGITSQTSISGSIEVPVNVKSSVALKNNPTSDTKYEDASDPFFSLQHRFVEGYNFGKWSPMIQLGLGAKLYDAERSNTEASLRKGGFEVAFLGGATKRLEKYILGLRAGYKAPLERTVKNVESGSTSKSTGGEGIILEAGFQFLSPEQNTFGLSISTQIISCVETTSTSSQGVVSKSDVSNYTRTALSAFGSLAVTEKTILNLSYRIALPYDLSEKIGNVEIQESSTKDYRISVGLSHLFEL